MMEVKTPEIAIARRMRGWRRLWPVAALVAAATALPVPPRRVCTTRGTGLFADPRLPAGYAPFDIAELAGKLYVTYAKQDAGLEDDVAGQGNGFVDVFTNDGALIRRLVTRGALDSPWGLALAPDNFGRFSGALLVGNFGGGHINAYNPDTGAHPGELRGPSGQPIAIPGLWSLRFGNGNAAKTNELIFSSGPGGEEHGLLGKLILAN